MNKFYVEKINLKRKIDESSYLNSIKSIKWLENNSLSFDNPITILVGENGSGKSTLIEAIAISMGFNPEGGTRNSSFSTKDTHSDLYDYLTITRSAYFKTGYFLRAESFYNTISYYDEVSSDVRNYVSQHTKSHGESFLNTAKDRFKNNGLFILDEPEAALSINRLMSLICIIHDAIENNCQFIIATHSPILMSYPKALVYQLSDDGIKKVNYKETDNYQVTKDFFNNPELMYYHLFNEE